MQMLGGPKPIKVSSEDSQSSSSSDESVQVQTTKRVFIKTIESKDGRVTNQRVEEKDRNLDRSMGALNLNPRAMNVSGSSSRDGRNMNLQNMNQREQQIPRQNQIPVAGSVKSRTSKFEAVNQSQAQAAAQDAQQNRTNQYVSISGNNSAVLRRKQIARPKSSSSSDSDSSSDSSGSTDSSDSDDSSD